MNPKISQTMRQFAVILRFELKNYFTNKIFVGVTVVLVALICGILSFPRISEVFDRGGQKNEHQITGEAESEDDSSERPVMLLTGSGAQELEEMFATVFPDYQVKADDDTIREIKDRILSDEVECAFEFKEGNTYTYYVNDLSMQDVNTAIADEALRTAASVSAMMESGMTVEEAQNVLGITVEHEVVKLGKDQMQNFFYAYIMIMTLYMVILLYGQMVAMGVATEKSSRAMELLVTTARPEAMMFGKIMAAGLAGLLQLIAVFGSAMLFYGLNESYWEDNHIIQSIFHMPGDLVAYMLIFFVLGFLIYAFLYGAIGSMATKLEDINTSVMPVMLVFVGAFLIVMFSISNGNVDSVLMKVSSYVPLTSPMAMFARIAMSTVPMHEILISIAILILSSAAVGVMSAKIYRVGVLLYGTPPKIGAIWKALRNA